MPRTTKKKHPKKNTALRGATASVPASAPAPALVSSSDPQEELNKIFQFLNNFCRFATLSPQALLEHTGNSVTIQDESTGQYTRAFYKQTDTGETIIKHKTADTSTGPLTVGTCLISSKSIIEHLQTLNTDINNSLSRPTLPKNMQLLYFLSYLVLLMRKLQKTGPLAEKIPEVFLKQKNIQFENIAITAVTLLASFSKEQIQMKIDGLQWYHAAEFSAFEEITEKNILKLFDTAVKSDLLPLKLFLIRHALSPEKKSLLSPVHIFDLGANPKFKDNNRVLMSLGLSTTDYGLFARVTDEWSSLFPFSYHHQLLWLVFKDPHRGFQFIPQHENNISEALQIFCSVILELIRDKADICTYLAKNFVVSAEKVAITPPTQLMKDVLYSLKNQDSFDDYIKNIEALIETEKSNYVKGFFYFLLGLYYRKQNLKRTDNSPLTTPNYYRRAARLDHPMLFKDAADIYMCHGTYEEAIECLQEWKQHFGSNKNISDESKLSVENQIELCQQNIDQLDTQAKQEAQATKEQEEQAEKHFAELMHALSLKASVDQPSCTNNPVASAPEPLPTPQETPNQDELSLMDEAFGAQQMTAKELQQAQRNTTRSKKKKQTQKGAQAEQWGEDDDYRTDEVRSFMKQLSIHKDKGSALGEISYATEMKSKVSPQGKKKKYFYGRICERLAWAHIHRVEQSFSLLEPLSTKETERHLAIAEENLIESLHYFTNGSSRLTRTITPNQLETVICTFYTKNRDHHQSPLYRLRLRSIASSLGHLYNNKKKYTQSSPYEKRFATRFFNLKTTADYEYKKTMVNKTRSKINIMKQRMFDQFSTVSPEYSEMIRVRDKLHPHSQEGITL